MSAAFAEAEEAFKAGEVPVGAVVVVDGAVVAADRNRIRELNDPTAHAELLVLGRAAREGIDLRRATLYVTLEPCMMCAGAIVLSRIKTLVYGADDPKTGAVRSLYTVLSDSRLNHQCQVIHGVGAARSSQILKGFFEMLRK
jgi:tRNA(adenine34) deaminase